MNSIKPASPPVKSLGTIAHECSETLRLVSQFHKDAPHQGKLEIESAVSHLLAAKSALYRAQWALDGAPSMGEVG